MLAKNFLQADVKLIDANFMQQNNISDDAEASKLIIETINRMKDSKSVFIFDIDSIAKVSKEFYWMQNKIFQTTYEEFEEEKNE